MEPVITEIEVVFVNPEAREIWAKTRAFDSRGEGINKPVAILSSTPVDKRKGSGLMSFPRVGDTAMAVDTGSFFYVMGWYADLNSRGHTYGLETTTSYGEGDVVLKGRARNNINMLASGSIELWSTFWASLKLDATLEKLVGIFKSLRLQLLGAIVEHSAFEDDKTSTRMVASKEYEPSIISDGSNTLESENMFIYTPQNSEGRNYIPKAVVRAGHFPPPYSDDGRVLEVDTRQSSGRTVGPMPKMTKDQYTQEIRGWREDGVAWETLVKSTVDGVTINERKGQVPEGAGLPSYLHKLEITDGDVTKTHQLAGSNVVFDKVEKADVFETSVTVDEDGVHTNIVKNTAGADGDVTRSHTINPTTGDLESFTLSKGKETLLTITVNDLGAVAITASSDVTLLSTGAVDIEAQGEAGAGKTYVDSNNDDVRVGINPAIEADTTKALTEGLDGIITPSTVFGRGANIWIDTFTGMPFIGSEKVMAKRDKA